MMVGARSNWEKFSVVDNILQLEKQWESPGTWVGTVS